MIKSSFPSKHLNPSFALRQFPLSGTIQNWPINLFFLFRLKNRPLRIGVFAIFLVNVTGRSYQGKNSVMAILMRIILCVDILELNLHHFFHQYNNTISYNSSYCCY